MEFDVIHFRPNPLTQYYQCNSIEPAVDCPVRHGSMEQGVWEGVGARGFEGLGLKKLLLKPLGWKQIVGKAKQGKHQGILSCGFLTPLPPPALVDNAPYTGCIGR